jgi:diacylglycerol O-acyltransferase
MEANYPIGPTGGTAWNLTLMSYDGHLDIGLNTDLAAVEDPPALRDAIVASFEELLAAGRPRARRRKQTSA